MALSPPLPQHLHVQQVDVRMGFIAEAFGARFQG